MTAPDNPVSPPAPPASGAVSSRRIDTLMASLKASDDAYFAAYNRLGESLMNSLGGAWQRYDDAMRRFGGKYLDALSKSGKRFDRAKGKLTQSLYVALTMAENDRDNAARAAGMQIPVVLQDLARGVIEKGIDEATMDWALVPMAQQAAMQSMGMTVAPLVDPPPPPPVFTSPDLTPIVDTTPDVIPLTPPPPASDTPPVDAVPIYDPPALDDTPPPSPLPYNPPECPSPGSRGYGPNVFVAVSPSQVPNGAVVLLTDPSGCTYYRFPVASPPPPKSPPPKSPPPPVSSCEPGQTVQVGCETIAYPWQSSYWIIARCRENCATELCIFYGPNPPVAGAGEYLYGPYQTAPTASDKEIIARAVCRRVGTAPPESPPTSPPPPLVPGVPPVTQPPAQQPPANRPPAQLPLPDPIQPIPGDDKLASWCGELTKWVAAANGGTFGGGGSALTLALENLFMPMREAGGVPGIIAGIFQSGLSRVGQFIGKAIEPLESENATAQGVILGPLAVAGWAERITGAPVTYLAEKWAQTMRYATPLFMPSQADANAQYLSGVITDQDWDCLTRTNGNRPEFARATLNASRVRPDVMALISLKRRGVITDQEYRASVRQQGVINDVDRVRYERATETIPQVSDIFRYIKKDVTNKEFVDAGELLEGFPEAYSGEVKAMGEAIGLSEIQARYEYMSEWEFPSTTLATEMFRRLRPGRKVEVEQVDNLGRLTVVTPKPFTIEDYKQVLKVNDVAPAYRDRALAVSYVPISLTDIKAMQKNGVIDKAEVIERLQDIGKNRPDAEALAELVVRDNARMLSNESGAWTRRRTVKEYSDGTISRKEAADLLSRTIPLKATIDGLLDDAETIRKANARRACINGVRRRYNVAELDERQATLALVGYGLTEDTASQLIEGWRCARISRAREPKVEMLKSWWVQDIITSDDFARRLINLGYNQIDASRIVRTAMIVEDEKRRKAAEKAASKLAAESRRIKREQDLAAARRKKAGG